MNANALFPSKYLKADDLGDDAEVIISHLKSESMKNNEGQDEDKWVLYFLSVDKGLVLNKTNAQEIAKQHGDETDAWKGKKITLTAQNVTAFGETKPAIRIKPKRTGTGTLGKPLAAKASLAEPVAVEEDTPF